MVQTKKQTKKIFFALGTVNTLTVFDENSEDALSRAKNRVMQLHKKLSAFDTNSEIGQINRGAGKYPVSVSADTLHLIASSVSYAQQTNGMFDITVHPLSMLWKNAIKQKALPSDAAITQKRELTNFRDILIDSDKSTVMLRHSGQALDLGAIAKGYAADEVKRIFLEENINDAIINLGGTVITLGESRKVGIQNPLEKTGKPFGYLELEDKAIVSSGLYEQGFTLNGRTYHHIVHPKTGYPTQSDLLGVTLIGESAEELDALSTVSLMLGMKAAANLLSLFGVEAVFITNQQRVYTTDKLKNKLQFI